MRSRIVDYLDSTTGLDIFGWLIPSPSVIYAIAFIVVVTVFAKRCKFSGLEKGIALDIGIWGGIAGLVISRIIYVALYQGISPFTVKSLFSSGGTTSWGVYIGILTGAYLFLRLKKRPVLPYLDVVAATIPLGTFIGRWSCFMDGCDYGTITDVVWAVRYPEGTLAHAAHINDMLVEPTAHFSLPVHPNQIYLSLNAMLVFLLVTWFWKKYRSMPGMTLGFYGLVYCLTRLIIEFFRDSPASQLIPALNLSQVMCVFVAGISLVLLAWLSFRENSATDAINNLKINKNLGEQKHV